MSETNTTHITSPPCTALQVEGLSVSAHRTGQHKQVPRWLRMSIRTAVLVGMIALPTLALKDPSFVKLTQYKGFSVVFASLGAFVVPMWIPLLGDIVLAFTAIIPVGLAGIWLAYGLFQACSSIIFMMLMCVALGAGVFFFAEWLSLPVGLLSVMPTLFIVGACTYVQMPARAWVITLAVTILLFIAALVAIWVCALVFPEYCVDEVFRHHHEALEHLLHLAYYAMGLQPPALVKRIYSSAAADLGAAKWRNAFRAADELPSSLQALTLGEAASSLVRSEGSEAWREESTAPGAQPTVSSSAGQSPGCGSGHSSYNRLNVKTERSWHRVAVACEAGSKAQVGAAAEVVLMAAHHKRIIVPCSPLLPCAKGQINTAGLLAMRHLALKTALHIIHIYNATQPLDASTARLLGQLLSEDEWSHMRSSLLAALQELTDAFPMDYYPVGAPPDRQHLTGLQEAVTALQAAWKQAKPAQAQHLQQQASEGSGARAAQQQEVGAAGAGAGAEHAAVTVLAEGQQEPPAAAVEVFKEPLVADDSPAAHALARMNTIHLMQLLQDLVTLLGQLYDAVEDVSMHMVSCRCC